MVRMLVGCLVMPKGMTFGPPKWGEHMAAIYEVMDNALPSGARTAGMLMGILGFRH